MNPSRRTSVGCVFRCVLHTNVHAGSQRLARHGPQPRLCSALRDVQRRFYVNRTQLGAEQFLQRVDHQGRDLPAEPNPASEDGQDEVRAARRASSRGQQYQSVSQAPGLDFEWIPCALNELRN